MFSSVPRCVLCWVVSSRVDHGELKLKIMKSETSLTDPIRIKAIEVR
jgi:hypothetical protein